MRDTYEIKNQEMKIIRQTDFKIKKYKPKIPICLPDVTEIKIEENHVTTEFDLG